MLDIAELWCYLLKESGSMDMESARELAGKGEDMKEATDHLIKLSKDEKIRLYKEAQWQERADRLAREDYVREEGLKQGLQRGLKQGQEQGREQTTKQLVLKMLGKKTDISFISEVTGLSETEINKITDKS